MIKKLGGRKAVVCYIVILVSVIVSAFMPNGITENMMLLFIGLVASFSAGNSAEHLAGALGQKQTKVDTSELENIMNKVVQRVDSIEHQNSIIGQHASAQAQATQALANRVYGKQD